VELRRQGVRVYYLEGNRDYRIAGQQQGRAFDESSETGRVEELGGRRIYAIHGDLVNPADKQYRLWRRISRSGIAWSIFNRLPPRTRLRWSRGAESRMRDSNLAFKLDFPEAEVRRYATGLFREGYDTVVLGHFHIEKDLHLRSADSSGRICVLPEWKGSRRHLEVAADGRIEFVDSMS
jgi:UDP-2,3-diacylglucosamine hydrolase